MKHNFITGKVSHHDAWPLVALRMDGKLDVVYGHSNDFECLTSVATLPLDVWTHVAVVVEQKKIKLFVNGALDAQAGTKGNARAVMYPIVVGSCPPSLRTNVEHVRVGFDGILAQYRYYTRALSPIHIRVVYDQGPPEAYDVRERWIFKLLTSLRLLLDSKHQVAPAAMQSAADRAMTLFITDSTRRVRCGALRLLERILALDAISDLSLAGHRALPALAAAPAPSPAGTFSRQSSGSTINAAAPPPAAPADPVVRMSDCTTLSLPEHAPFRERLALYFIRVIGACWSPALAATGPADAAGGVADASTGGGGGAPVGSSSGGGSNNNNNNTADSNNAGVHDGAAASEGLGLSSATTDGGGLAAGRAQLLEFLAYTPGILCENLSGNGNGNGSQAGGGAAAPTPLFGDRAAAPRSLVLGEMSFHLVSLLRAISSVSNWGYAISAVAMNVLSKVRCTLCVVGGPRHARVDRPFEPDLTPAPFPAPPHGPGARDGGHTHRMDRHLGRRGPGYRRAAGRKLRRAVLGRHRQQLLRRRRLPGAVRQPSPSPRRRAVLERRGVPPTAIHRAPLRAVRLRAALHAGVEARLAGGHHRPPGLPARCACHATPGNSHRAPRPDSPTPTRTP